MLWFDICSKQTKRFMKSYILLFLCVFILSSFKADFHKTYLSVTEVEYSDAEHTLQIVSRVFINDFEDVLSKRYQQEVSLSYKADLKSNKMLMQKYLAKKLVLQVDGKEINLKLLGSKFDADQIVLFLEAENIQSFKRVEVENLILTDLFDAQKNITHVKKGDDIESMLLTKANSSNTVIF